MSKYTEMFWQMNNITVITTDSTFLVTADWDYLIIEPKKVQGESTHTEFITL